MLRGTISVAFVSLCAFGAALAAPTARAQSTPSSGTQPTAQAPTAPASAPTQERRVWTNEDMPSGKPANGAASQSGTNAGATKTGTKNTGNQQRDARWYHDQILRLQEKLPPLEKDIAELEAAIRGKPTGDAATSSRPRGVKSDDWATELAQAKKQHDDVLAKIEALKDEARHRGVSPNDLP